MEKIRQAIESSSCPRNPGDSLDAPLCDVDDCMGDSTPLLSVKRPPQSVYCAFFVGVGRSQFCLCKNRKRVYLTYGI